MTELNPHPERSGLAAAGVLAGIVVTMVLVAVVVGVLFGGHVKHPLHEFPTSVTVPDRSCYADRCAQALPGGLIRVTDRAGNVIGVWWR